MKLKNLLPLSFLLPTLALAQSVTLQSGVPKPTTDIYGDLAVCLGPTNVQKLSCDASDNLNVNVGAMTASSNATFAAADVTGFAGIGAAYVSAVDLPDATKVVILDNQTNGDVTVSMDGGATDTFFVKPGDVISLNLASSGLKTTADVQVKDGTTNGTAGSFYVYSYK